MNKHKKNRDKQARTTYNKLRGNCQDNQNCTDMIKKKGLNIKDINSDMVLFVEETPFGTVKTFFDHIEIKTGKKTIMRKLKTEELPRINNIM